MVSHLCSDTLKDIIQDKSSVTFTLLSPLNYHVILIVIDRNVHIFYYFMPQARDKLSVCKTENVPLVVLNIQLQEPNDRLLIGCT